MLEDNNLKNVMTKIKCVTQFSGNPDEIEKFRLELLDEKTETYIIKGTYTPVHIDDWLIMEDLKVQVISEDNLYCLMMIVENDEFNQNYDDEED